MTSDALTNPRFAEGKWAKKRKKLSSLEGWVRDLFHEIVEYSIEVSTPYKVGRNGYRLNLEEHRDQDMDTSGNLDGQGLVLGPVDRWPWTFRRSTYQYVIAHRPLSDTNALVTKGKDIGGILRSSTR